MSIFDELSDFGGERCAVHIGARSFSSLALSSLWGALSQSVGTSVQLLCPDAKPPYAVKLISVNGISESEKLGLDKSETQFVKENGDFFLKVDDALQLEFSLGVLGRNGLDAFSSLTLKICRLQFQIEPSDDQLVCAPGAATLTPSLTRLSDFNSVINGYGIDPTDVARVEGMLLYSGLASALRNSMATPRTVDLRRLFPGIAFQDGIKFKISKDGKQLFVTGSKGATRRPESHCECADVSDGIGPVTPGTIEAVAENGLGQSGVESDLVAEVTIGGPSRVKANSVIGSLRSQGEGDNGLFMPVTMAEGFVDGPFPGVRFDLGDEGFIGWKTTAFIDFSKLEFKPEPMHGRFFVTLGFRAEINGSVYVDLGKLGKIRVTNFRVEQAEPRPNTVTIGFHAVIRAGELLLKPVLEDVSFGEFNVRMPLFTLLGTPFGTKGAVVGFILEPLAELPV